MSEQLDESTAVKHVTEWGIGLCWAQANGLKIPPVTTDNDAHRATRDREVWFSERGLRPDTIACTGSQRVEGAWFERVYASVSAPVVVPTCPHCAVLRDAALEGRLVGVGVGSVP